MRRLTSGQRFPEAFLTMAEQGEIKLVSFWSSPFVLRVRLALELKGLKYEILEEQDLFNGKSQLLLESNPVHKKVPVLLHNGKAICESMIIIQYLDEVWPEGDTRPGFFPTDAYDRAKARFWADFIDHKFFKSASRAIRATGEDKTKANMEFVQNCITLEEVLSKSKVGPFFGGSKMGYVDIALSYMMNRLPVTVELTGLPFPDSEQCPRLHAWMQAVGDSPAAKTVFPDREKLKDYFKVAIERRRKQVATS